MGVIMNPVQQAARLGILAMLSILLLSGCATPPKPLYYWGDYQSNVYGHLKGEKGPEEQIEMLERTREEAKSKSLPLPPGFQAHLAMLYGQTGRSERLVENLEAEKNQYPESSTFMDFLLKKFNP